MSRRDEGPRPPADAGDEPLRRRPAPAHPPEIPPPAPAETPAEPAAAGPGRRGSQPPRGGERREPRPRAARRGPPLDARLAAAHALADVLDGRMSLNAALPRYSERVVARDRGLAAELAYGTLRLYPRLALLLDQLLERPLAAGTGLVRGLLLCGLYQLDHLRVPEYAAVASTVEAARALRHQPWAAGLVNAVLRNRQRRRAALDAALAAEPVAVHAHPAWLLERLQADWPADWPAIVEASNQQAPMMLRVNLARESRDEALARLAAAGIAAAAHAQVASAVVLEHPAEVTALPGFADGRLSVQDGAGQLAAPLLAPEPGDRVLDACCAPGGKTGHLLETALGLELLALDIDATRLVRVRENLDRLGYDAELLAADAAAPADWWDGRPFERILLDAPCSATGVIRRHPDIKALRQPADIDALAARQRALLDALWPLLAPGGILLYATCSLLRAENETVIAAFLAAHPDAAELVIDADWGLALRHGRQILPGSAGLDGFYYARLLRTP